MGKILGLDLGTASVGWALVTQNEENLSSIDAIGSRIIPTDAATLSDFGRGNPVSQTKERTMFRSARRLRERHLLRRQRLFRVLAKIGYLPEHFSAKINALGHFVDDTEPKIAWDGTQFIFKDSFEEMLVEFKSNNPNLFLGEACKVPYDWTIYYLRKKALYSEITREELAWIVLNFNQKRGYYQLRGEDEENKKEGEEVEYKALRVVSVEATDQKKGNQIWYKVHLENGWIYSRASAVPLDWEGKVREFIITTQYDSDGNPKLNKDGGVKRSFRAPVDNDWALMKIKSEGDIADSGKSVGEYIYDSMLNNPSQKIKGGLVRVIERKFYKEELLAILAKQSEFHSELRDETIYNDVIEDLYRSNDGYRASIEGRDLIYLLVDNIIFYQRPLKTKRSLIADCKFEYYQDKEGKKYRLKSIAKSHPLYQEFRLWKFISHLRVFKGEEDVTEKLLKSEEDYVSLFKWLNTLGDIDNAAFVKYKGFDISRAEQKYYRWNYVVEGKKKYPCNQTLSVINKRLAKKSLPPIADDLVTHLWHILYSVTDREDIKKALSKFAINHNYDCELFVDALKGCIFEREYGAYSQKAITRLLSLMRKGDCWCQDAIDARTLRRIENIINGVFDSTIDERTREKCSKISQNSAVSDFRGLDEWLASYVIYGRHSEDEDAQQWQNPSDIDDFLKSFRQHSLCNPIVEKIVTETLRVVRDVWQSYGSFDKIHIEMAREMKQTQEQRRRYALRVVDNENTNYRIRKLLEEFQDPSFNIEGVRALSPSHQDIFKIYEEYALSQNELPEDIISIYKRLSERDEKKQPTKGEITRYKLWLEQQYRSPYTGDVIPLGRLFATEYEIEHIIPRSLYSDNSLSNKVICESEVNKLKSNRVGLKFIQEEGSARVSLSGGRYVTIFDEAQYLDHIDRYYTHNARKAKNLKAADVPDEFSSSQLNNTRYITKFIASKLANIVREEGEVESLSKNIVITSGNVTDVLKREWGLSDVWNKIVAPRFERLNAATNSNAFGEWVCDDGNRFFRTSMPLELSKGFTKKRIDHRHHAMDAVVIACTTRSHINYLNNISSGSDKSITRYQLRSNLCYKHKPDSSGSYQWRFYKPWDSFTQDVYRSLMGVVVSFKQNLRVINKATNTYEKFVDGKRVRCKQEGENWAIRKSMHKDTVAGLVNLQRIVSISAADAVKCHKTIVDKKLRAEISKNLDEGLDAKKIAKGLRDRDIKRVEVYIYTSDTDKPYSASRKVVDASFDVKKIESVTDNGIVKILLAHLSECGGDRELAFSAEGLEQMNLNLKRLNGGKDHKPIVKVRVSETLGNKYNVGVKGAKAHKFVEAAKGTNLFFAIYQDENGERSYDSIPLNVVIENQKQGLPSAPAFNAKGESLKYVLSPNSLVYLPTPEQVGLPLSVEDVDVSRVYKMVSCTGNQAFFVCDKVSSVIVDKMEYGSMNKTERAVTGEMIKSLCIPIEVDRLGRIVKIEQ